MGIGFLFRRTGQGIVQKLRDHADTRQIREWMKGFHELGKDAYNANLTHWLINAYSPEGAQALKHLGGLTEQDERLLELVGARKVVGMMIDAVKDGAPAVKYEASFRTQYGKMLDAAGTGGLNHDYISIAAAIWARQLAFCHAWSSPREGDITELHAVAADMLARHDMFRSECWGGTGDLGGCDFHNGISAGCKAVHRYLSFGRHEEAEKMGRFLHERASVLSPRRLDKDCAQNLVAMDLALNQLTRPPHVELRDDDSVTLQRPDQLRYI